MEWKVKRLASVGSHQRSGAGGGAGGAAGRRECGGDGDCRRAADGRSRAAWADLGEPGRGVVSIGGGGRSAGERAGQACGAGGGGGGGGLINFMRGDWCLASHADNVRLRWPNDVVLGGKKVVGILCESAAIGRRWAGVMGVGINVNVDEAALPVGIRESATSLGQVSGGRYQLRGLEQMVLAAIGDTVLRAGNDGLAAAVACFRRLDAPRGHALVLRDDEREFAGVAAGIGDGGELLLNSGGTIRPVVTATLVAIDGAYVRRP